MLKVLNYLHYLLSKQILLRCFANSLENPTCKAAAVQTNLECQLSHKNALKESCRCN